MVQAKHMRAALFAVFLAALVLAAAAGPAGAVTSLEGYTDFMAEWRSSGGGDPSWDFYNPRLYAELKLMTSPWRDIDGFLKLTAESNRWTDDLKDTKLFFREAHMQYRWSHVEALLFAGQDRFWLNEPLLGIMDPGQVKHDDYGPRAQGIRVDFRDVKGLSGAAFLSERSDYVSRGWDQLSESEQEGYPGSTVGDTIGSSTDDYRAFRLTRNFMEDRIYVGTTYARKDFSASAFKGERGNFDEVTAFDVELALGDLVPGLDQFGLLTWVTEYGYNSSGWLWDVDDPGRHGFKTELRDFKVGPLRFLGSYEEFDQHFYTQGLAHGDRQDLNGYSRYYVEGRYRVPRKAIDLKYWTFRAEPDYPTITSKAESDGTIQEWGTEAYMQFVNGFTGKVEYKVYENNYGTWPNLFFEVTGENRLVKLRTQLRVRDIDTNYEVTAYGFEANVNLGERWKFYARVMNVDEKTESRQTAFAQLRYLGWSGAEFFVEFGNPDQSNDLVNDGDFVEHGKGDVTDQVFKAFVRVYY